MKFAHNIASWTPYLIDGYIGVDMKTKLVSNYNCSAKRLNRTPDIDNKMSTLAFSWNYENLHSTFKDNVIDSLQMFQITPLNSENNRKFQYNNIPLHMFQVTSSWYNEREKLQYHLRMLQSMQCYSEKRTKKVQYNIPQHKKSQKQQQNYHKIVRYNYQHR